MPFAGIRGVHATSAGGKILGILHVSQALYQPSYISRQISLNIILPQWFTVVSAKCGGQPPRS